MEPFRSHLFVCAQQKPEGIPSCPASGSFAVFDALDRETVAELWHGMECASEPHKSKRRKYLETIVAALPVIPYMSGLRMATLASGRS